MRTYFLCTPCQKELTYCLCAGREMSGLHSILHFNSIVNQDKMGPQTRSYETTMGSMGCVCKQSWYNCKKTTKKILGWRSRFQCTYRHSLVIIPWLVSIVTLLDMRWYCKIGRISGITAGVTILLVGHVNPRCRG